MNATLNTALKHLLGFGQPQRAGLNVATPAATKITGLPAVSIGSYGRGVYAGHATYVQDFNTQGSYGRGVYAGRNTADINFDTPGSYGRGVYANRSSADLNFGIQGSFASQA